MALFLLSILIVSCETALLKHSQNTKQQHIHLYQLL